MSINKFNESGSEVQQNAGRSTLKELIRAEDGGNNDRNLKSFLLGIKSFILGKRKYI